MRRPATFLLAATLCVGLAVPAHAEETSTQPHSLSQTVADHRSGNLASIVDYNLRDDMLRLDPQRAKEAGFSASEVQTFQENLDQLGPAQTRELAEVIGFYPDYFKQARPLPAVLIPILGFVGAAAAQEIISQVTNWGVAGACRNLQGNWGAFDNFCRSNGHI